MGISLVPRAVWRVLVGLVLIASLLWFPIWVTGIIAIADALFFNAWPEVLALGILIDIVFGSTFSSLGSIRHVLWAIGIIGVTQLARHQTRVMYGFS